MTMPEEERRDVDPDECDDETGPPWSHDLTYPLED
jgi:hypothetical protein